MQRHAGPLARDFMGSGVVTVFQDSSVSKAVSAMDRHNIGSVVVLDNLGPCGVFTERDLLSKVIRKGRDPESTVMTEVLSPAFPAVDVSETLDGAAKAMVQRRSRLMVFDGPELVGMVTPTDIVRMVREAEADFGIEGVVSKRLALALPETPVDLVVRQMDDRRVGSVLVSDEAGFKGIFTERDLLKRVLAPRKRLDTMVGDLITCPLVTAEYGVTGREAAGVMASHGIKRLPLTAVGSLTGIVTARDVVEAFAAPRKASGPRIDWMQWN
jgi:CBS domain-containing protein